MVEAGYQPAKIQHLMAYGTKFPEEQRKFPIVALGSVALVGRYRRVAYLHRNGAQRALSLRRRDGDWEGFYRFLAVRNLAL